MRGVFVTGTDTGVGKTTVSAALMARFASARYWKPVQTGIEIDDDTAEVLRLSGRGAESVRPQGVRLHQPVSPHLAARLAGVRIDLDEVAEWTLSALDEQAWILEGAGGVLVPLNESQTMAHLMVRLGLPVVLVARGSLGTINHTLLSLEALRARSLTLAGVVMVGEPNPENREAIEHYGRVEVIGELPRLHPLNAASLGAWAANDLDRAGVLAEFLA